MTTTIELPADDEPTPDRLDLGRPSPAPWPLAALAGLLAGAVALAIAELVSGFNRRIPSLVIAVGDWVVDNGFQELDNWARETFGTGQKTVLVTGIVVTSLAIAVVAGLAARRERSYGIAIFAGFALAGALAGTQDPQASDVGAWFAGIAAGAAGIATLLVLLQLAERRDFAPRGRSAVATFATERRWFLGAAGGALFTTLFGTQLGSYLRSRRDVEGARTEVAASLSTESPSTALASLDTFDSIEGISPFITPNDDFYRIDTALSTPLVDPESWSLRVTGMVDSPFELTFDELLALPSVEETVTLSCVSNEVGGGLVGNAIWTGVPLRDILDRAGVSPDATQIVGRSVDSWTAGFPTEIAFDGRTALVAYAMNGEPLPVAHGFPARLVVGGLYGYVSATKWLREIELTTWEDFDGYWIPRGWSKEGPIKTQSRIDVPRTASVEAGPTAIAGVAWAPHRSIQMVEVQIDDGPWVPAELSEELNSTSWRQWMYSWDATPGDHRVRVRATDGSGMTQGSTEIDPRPNGAEGWHTRTFRVQRPAGT